MGVVLMKCSCAIIIKKILRKSEVIELFFRISTVNLFDKLKFTFSRNFSSDPYISGVLQHHKSARSKYKEIVSTTEANWSYETSQLYIICFDFLGLSYNEVNFQFSFHISLFYHYFIFSLDRLLLATILTLYMYLAWNTDQSDYHYHKYQYERKHFELESLKRYRY